MHYMIFKYNSLTYRYTSKKKKKIIKFKFKIVVPLYNSGSAIRKKEIQKCWPRLRLFRAKPGKFSVYPNNS